MSGGCSASLAKSAPPTNAPAYPSVEEKAGGRAEQGPAEVDGTARAGQPGVSSAPPATAKSDYRWATPPNGAEWREPATLEEAEQSLARDEAGLGRMLTEADQAQLSQPSAAGGETCRSVCAALGSMRRSAAAVCRLAGDYDERCQRAKQTVTRNEGRVRDTACGCAPE